MKALGLQTLKVSDIDFGDRLRQVDESHAQLLAENIREVGLLRQPIEVRKLRKGYVLVAGGHRLRALQLLERDQIEAFVFDMTGDEARLAEIDENLVRHDLNPLDRAVFLWQRKEVYERLHPETKHGAQGGRGGKRNEQLTLSFSNDVAERCNISAATVKRATFIASRLAADVRAALPGTPIARKQSELMALAKLPAATQRAVMALLLASPPKAKTVEAARRLATGVKDIATPSAEKALAKLLRAWDEAPAAARRSFIEHLRETGQLESQPGNEKEAA